ncbi:MAG: ATP-dependent DNA ligase [Candidatus Bathyarchaeia archaeon]
MKYSIIADAYERIEATTKRLEMTELLADLFRRTPKGIIDKVVYLSQGKICPDYMGIELGVAEKLAIRAIAASSGKREGEVEELYRRVGDLGRATEVLLERRSQSTLFREALTVEDVHDAFDKISRSTGPGSVDSKIRLLTKLLNNASPKEGKYIVRTALGKLRLGIADMTILDALSVAFAGTKELREEIERAYNLSSDLGYVAKKVAEEGLEGIKRFGIILGRPIRPMLAERLSSPSEILEKLGGRGSAEYKYDGLRVQAHISGDSILLFSRRLENITGQFPDVVSHLREAVESNGAVLEGECVGVDPNTGEMMPFQMISQRRGRKYMVEEMAEEIPVIFFAFDALYAGRDLTREPYPVRRRELEGIVRETDFVKIAERKIVSDPVELEAYFEHAISLGCEGLVVKSLQENSVYQAGARGWLWIKYKRSYKAEAIDTFDLVPVGAFMGRGKRAGTYGALLMAAYNDEEDVFETICKLGSGFTDEDLKALPEKMKPYVIGHKHPRVKSQIEPDVWLVPSLVMEIAADEISLSPLHTCSKDSIRRGSGFALRFPRFTGNWRADKSPEDATTSKEVAEMYRNQLKRISE